MVALFVDIHCHLYEFDPREISRFSNMIIVAVSDDLNSSIKTLKLAETYGNVVPCVGLHPWEIDENSLDVIDRIIDIAVKANVKCFGEIGLDKKFVPESYELQYEIFKEFIDAAVKYNIALNIHAAGAWRDVFKLIYRRDISRAVFHWYTGPLDLLKEIVESGYFISINPAVKIQKKHLRVLEKTPLENILTESDGPYKYRGLYLTPLMIPETVELIAKVKGVDLNVVKKVIIENFKKFIGEADNE